MGVCINQKLGQNKVYIKDTLDRAENYAKSIKKTETIGLDVEIRRLSDFALYIDVGGCETLVFDFKSVEQINSQGKNGWDYEYNVLTNDGAIKLDEGYMVKEYPQNEKWYSAGFTKTQYAGNIMAHKLVADLIKVVASRCFMAQVNDEGDYYHSGKLGDAIGAIKENGAMIEELGATLSANFGPENIIKGGKTKIGK